MKLIYLNCYLIIYQEQIYRHPGFYSGFDEQNSYKIIFLACFEYLYILYYR